jgi:hypothetical protein
MRSIAPAAMAAGVTTQLWDLVDMVRVIEDWEARRDGKGAGYGYIQSL